MTFNWNKLKKNLTNIFGRLNRLEDKIKIINYSENESVIGEWIDGRKLYRRVYTRTLGSAGLTNIDIDELVADVITNVFVSFGKGEAQNYAYTSQSEDSSVNFLEVRIDTDLETLTIRRNPAEANSIFYVILEYVK